MDAMQAFVEYTTAEALRTAPEVLRKKNTMRVEVHLRETSQVIAHEADNTYQKGDLFCVKVASQVYKYPLANIWRVVEDYSVGDRTTAKTAI